MGPPHYMMWKSLTLTFNEIPERCYGTCRQRHMWPAAQYDLLWTDKSGSLTVPPFSGRLQYRILAKRAREFRHTWICVLVVLHSAFLSINSTSVGTALLLYVTVIMTNLYKTGNVRLNITYRRVRVTSGKFVTHSEWVFIAYAMSHAKRIRRITLSSVGYLALPYFFTLSRKLHNFRGGGGVSLNISTLSSPTTSILKTSHSKKNSARHESA